MKLPGAARAVVDPAKLQDYLLSPSHPVGRFKAFFFATLGYTARNWDVLQSELLQVARTQDSESVEQSAYGEKFELRATLVGPNGRSSDIITVWIVRGDEDFPRFVTAYPD